MLIERKSHLSGKVNVMEIDVTNQELEAYYDSDRHIQDILGHLTADEREFIKTGVTVAEWVDAFGEEE
jgi:hypothetical protein